ncbi:MAG: TonB-dependent receptor [Muribaculaceae bacterium]|nr:TonB-dependent receptor [Lachnospiraceae bacterium]MCM1297487.1 TonB-dependent receptor [Muribaculaceae bacterium]
MNIKILIVTLAGILLSSFHLNAEILNESEGINPQDSILTQDFSALDEVVVTATRTPKALKDVPVVTRVITEDEIGKVDATNIQDLLTEELPGLEFGYAMSQETSLNMSGFGGNAVLFLVDGERLAGETMDNVDYNRLNLDNVGRVEIVKGASSALYGANAVGGVINIISRDCEEPWRVNLNSRYRSAGNEWRSGADVNFHAGKWTSNTNFQVTKVDRIELTDAFDTESKIHEIFGGKTLNVKERLTYQISDKMRVIARGGFFTRESNRANYDDHYKDYTAGLRSVINFSPVQNLEVSYSFDQYDKARFVGGKRTHDHDYSNRQHVVHALYNHYFGKDALTIGGDYMNDYLTTYQFAGNEVHSQNSVDVFAQYDYNPLNWLNLVGSVRYDHFSASHNNAFTARLASMFKLSWMSIRASYAGGFRAPTLKEMYMNFDMAGIQMIYGNPDLKPEKSHNFNVALERNGNVHHAAFGGAYSVTVMGYYNLYNSRITTTDFPGTPTQDNSSLIF